MLEKRAFFSKNNRLKTVFSAILVLVFFFSAAQVSFAQESRRLETYLPDLSGLAWVEADIFLGVHDAKNKGKNSDPSQPRLSLLQLPTQEKPLLWQVLRVDWPNPEGLSNDLESITSIPKTNLFLLAESGGEKPFQRLFLIAYNQQKVKIVEQINWPIPVKNVEAIAVSRQGDRYLFIYAERADSQESTKIRWTDISFNPLKFGEFQSVTFRSPQGNIYIASAYDPDSAGVFRSAVYRIGQVTADNSLIIAPNPQKIAEIDGSKVEAVTTRESPRGKIEVFIGTDDENYGGFLRPLLLDN
ncbi:MAG: hypothetical protein EWV82_00870 [Microcystis aeruginosa Ma_AC_P_19900807_S299]|nr:MAG: hypothetical protein EWV82_00870 [Microcystis aeruginosa Ma_AC_P_19900807_S299]